jgi:hypothetical protein
VAVSLGAGILALSAKAGMIGRQEFYQTELPLLVDSMAEAGVPTIHAATEKRGLFALARRRGYCALTSWTSNVSSALGGMTGGLPSAP